jgi:lipoprotein-anchoring transpeptidase ErfK/SrfK
MPSGNIGYMKKFLFIMGSLLFLVKPNPSNLMARAQSTEPDSGSVVCPAEAYPTPPDDCFLAGPSEYLTGMADLGLTFPPRPLASQKPDPSLTTLPYFYFRLDNDDVPMLSGPAGSPSGQVFPPGFVYVSYDDRVDTGKGIYYLLQSGAWIAGQGARVSEISAYQGLEFNLTPNNPFGWPFEYIPVKKAPGYNTQETGKYLNPFIDIVHVYDTQNVDSADWNMIGPNEWVEARKVAIVTPKSIPPEGVTGNRWIDVDLAEQTLAVYENNELVFATVIASGLEPFYTRPGLFQIYEKKDTETMRNNDPTDFYYLDNVPWTMYFDKARALHGAYWRTRFGYPQSHGCINLSVGDSHWLYLWASVGDYVYIYDTTGQTPTDPSLYKDWAY